MPENSKHQLGTIYSIICLFNTRDNIDACSRPIFVTAFNIQPYHTTGFSSRMIIVVYHSTRCHKLIRQTQYNKTNVFCLELRKSETSRKSDVLRKVNIICFIYGILYIVYHECDGEGKVDIKTNGERIWKLN